MMRPARLTGLAVVIGLGAFLVHAFAAGAVVADQRHGWQVVWGVYVWGIYVWVGAYSGFLFFSPLIHACERRLGPTIVLVLITCATGNRVNAAWLLWRGPGLFRRIRSF